MIEIYSLNQLFQLTNLKKIQDILLHTVSTDSLVQKVLCLFCINKRKKDDLLVINLTHVSSKSTEGFLFAL